MFGNFGQVGFYTLAAGLVEKMWLFPESMREVIFVEVANQRKGKEFVARLCRISFFVLATASLLLGVSAPFFIPLLYSKEFLPAVLPFIILLPGILIFSFSKLLASYFAAINMVKINTYASILALVLNLGLNFWLIPKFGMNGAAIASTISYSAGAFLQVGLFLQRTKLPISAIFILHRSDFALLNELIRKILLKFGVSK